MLDQSELTKANTTSTRSANGQYQYQSIPTDFKKSTTSSSSILTQMPADENRGLPTFGQRKDSQSYLEHFKMVLVGDRSVGKTCLVVTYGTRQFPDKQPPTVLEAYQGVTSFRGREVIVDIFDTAGHEDFQRVRPISYNKADVIIICFSLVDKNSLTNACTTWYREVRQLGPKCPIILVGTKLDLREKQLQSGDLAKQCIRYEEGKQ